MNDSKGCTHIFSLDHKISSLLISSRLLNLLTFVANLSGTSVLASGKISI